MEQNEPQNTQYTDVAQPVSQTPLPPNSQVHPNQNLADPSAPHPHTGTVILQWLTYAFWGWTVLAMSFLTATVFESYIGDSNIDAGAPYAIAAVLVLLPMSVICDIFYSKQEPVKKAGGASLVMIIHAVLFALIAVGSLITGVFSVVNMLTSSSDSAGTKVTLYTSAVVTLLYVAVLLRTLRPIKFAWVRRYFIIFMVLVVGIITVFGIIGPVNNARITKNDRLIEGSLGSLSDSVNTYADKNHQLPNNLGVLDLMGDAKKLVTDNLVTYQPNTIQPSIVADNYSPSDLVIPKTNSTYYYQMCVDFKKANGQSDGSSANSVDQDGYVSYLYVYAHGAGKTCYKVKTTSYN